MHTSIDDFLPQIIPSYGNVMILSSQTVEMEIGIGLFKFYLELGRPVSIPGNICHGTSTRTTYYLWVLPPPIVLATFSSTSTAPSTTSSIILASFAMYLSNPRSH
jgi:hypothetical protein